MGGGRREKNDKCFNYGPTDPFMHYVQIKAAQLFKILLKSQYIQDNKRHTA